MPPQKMSAEHIDSLNSRPFEILEWACDVYIEIQYPNWIDRSIYSAYSEQNGVSK